MTRARANWSLWSVLVTAQVACVDAELNEATEVIVVVDSDQELKPRLAHLNVEVRDEAGEAIASSHLFDLHDESSLPLSFGIHKQPGGASWFMLSVSGLDAENKPVVAYKTIDHFEDGHTRHLQVHFGNLCVNNFCDGHPEQTCNFRTGRCEDIRDMDAGPMDLPDGEGPGADGGPNDGGQGPDAGDGGTSTMPVPPSLVGIATLGDRRTDGVVAVYDDGFEQGERLCTNDGQFCVTGGFAP